MLVIPIPWIIDSLNTIKEPKKNDACLAGSFTGAVMEFLGRVSLYPDDTFTNNNGKTVVKNEACFYEFIERYLKECNPRYLTHKKTLWKFSRCSGAHNILPQFGLLFSGDDREKGKHLTVRSDFKDFKGRALLVYLPEFINDLKWSVEKFSYNLSQDALLKDKERKVMDKLYHDGQKYINNNFPLDDID